jgi:Rieske 2Fe-2S family protein
MLGGLLTSLLSAMAFPVSPAELDAVLAPFERAVGLPTAAYHDEAVFAHERRAIFDRAWHCVGREDDVRHPGEWLRAPLCPEGILVVRGADLELRAFYNVCRHRATPLTEGPCGRAREFICPYHGWTYDLRGVLRDAPHAPIGLDHGAHGLSPVRVDVWQGFVFVAVDESLPSLHVYLAEVPEWLSRASLAEARRVHRSEYEVAANWKLLVQNFQESHHFTRIHPALERLTPKERAQSVLSDGPWLGGTMAFADGVETVSRSGKRNGRPYLASPPYRQQVSDAILFPALLTSLQPDYFLTYRLVPLTAERTRVIAETFVHPAAVGPSFDPSDLTAFWEVVNAQDRDICEKQQVGIRSRGYRATRYATVEEGVHAFDCRVARAYAS